MSLQTWQETIVTQQGAGTSFGTFTTAKTVINAQALASLPVGFWSVGKTIRVRVAGGVGTLVTTPGTIVFQVMIGSAIAFTTGVIQLNATAHTNIPFELEVLLTCRALGAGTSANCMGQGRVFGIMFTPTAGQTDGANSHAMMLAPNTAPAVGAGFDSTVATVLDLFCGFSVSSGSNTIKIEQYVVECLN